MLYGIAIRLGNVKRRRRRANIRGNTQLVLHVTLQPPRDRRSTEFTKPDRGCRFFSFSVECKCVAKKPATRDVRYTWPTCQCCRNLNLDINRWSPCRSDPEVFAVWYAAWHDRSNVGNLIRLAVPSYKSSLVEYSVISCYLNANLHKRNKKIPGSKRTRYPTLRNDICCVESFRWFHWSREYSREQKLEFISSASVDGGL